MYSGRTPVTGYFVDLKEASAKDDQWRGLNEAAIGNKYLRVRGCLFLLKRKATNTKLTPSESSSYIEPLVRFHPLGSN